MNLSQRDEGRSDTWDEFEDWVGVTRQREKLWIKSVPGQSVGLMKDFEDSGRLGH